jgi:hypothetical protein
MDMEVGIAEKGMQKHAAKVPNFHLDVEKDMKTALAMGMETEMEMEIAIWLEMEISL